MILVTHLHINVENVVSWSMTFNLEVAVFRKKQLLSAYYIPITVLKRIMCIMSFSPHSHPKSQTLWENEDEKDRYFIQITQLIPDRAGILYLNLGV